MRAITIPQRKQFMNRNRTSIDSIQLFIPIKRTTMVKRQTQATSKPISVFDVEIKDQRMLSNIVSYYETTGEVREVKQCQPFLHQYDGITTSYRVLKKSVGPSTITGVSVGLTAKMLKGDYLKGITNNTIEQVYNELIYQDIIGIRFNDLMQSKVDFIDIKRDTEYPNLQEAFNSISSRIKTGADYKRHSNGNITIGQRKTANNSNLYIKFYDKRQELESNSNIFNSCHLPCCPANLLRTEITLHSKHLNAYFTDYDNALNSMLNVLDIQGDQVMNTILSEHLNHDPREPANESEKPDKTMARVQRLVNVIMGNPEYRRLADVQDEVVAILDLGRDRARAVKQVVADLFAAYLDDEQNLQPFTRKGGGIK